MTDQPTSPPSFLKLMASSTARHIATGVAGSLVTMGALSNSQAVEFSDVISALAVYGLTLWWSAAQHKKTVNAKS